MALVKCEEENIRAIAEAIRLNPNFTDTYNISEMSEIITKCIDDYREKFNNLFSERYLFNIIKLPNSINKIRRYAFSNCINLALTSLPESITEIGQNAFYNCTNLALTSLPEGLTKIEYYAFDRCTNLALTELPKGLTHIEGGAFYHCINLKSLTFKGTPQFIDSNTFYGCNNLTTINVPWSEGEVANAPWGAINATINYNTMVVN